MKKIILLLALVFFISSCQEQEIIRYTSVTMDSTASSYNAVEDVNCIVTIQGDNITIEEDSTYVTEGTRTKEGSNTFKCMNGMVYQVRDDGLYVYSGSGFMFKYF